MANNAKDNAREVCAYQTFMHTQFMIGKKIKPCDNFPYMNNHKQKVC